MPIINLMLWLSIASFCAGKMAFTARPPAIFSQIRIFWSVIMAVLAVRFFGTDNRGGPWPQASMRAHLIPATHATASRSIDHGGIVRSEFMSAQTVCLSFVNDSVDGENKAPLSHAVRHVLRVCSEKQMGWIRTFRIIATMANRYLIRNRPYIDHVTISVCQEAARTSSRLSNNTITNNFSAFPFPAFIGSETFNFFPKSFFHRASLVRSHSTTFQGGLTCR